jgi:hypothetical protein
MAVFLFHLNWQPSALQSKVPAHDTLTNGAKHIDFNPAKPKQAQPK